MNTLYIFIGVIVAIFALLIITFMLKKMKGSIQIIPDKYNFSSGESINGKLILKLKKPVHARNLVIGLKCERIERNSQNSSNRSQPKTTHTTLFDFNQPLEGEKDYASSEYIYTFSINLPKDELPKLQGITAMLVKSAQILMGQTYSVKWYLYAELQCDGLNLSQKVQVNVS